MSTEKIKILFRHRSMEMGGVEKVLLSLLHNLDREKFDLTVLLSLNQGELRNAFPADVRKVYLTEGKEDFSTNRWVQNVQLFQRKLKLEKFRKHPELIDKDYLKQDYDIEIAMTYNDFEMVLQSSNKKSKKIGWFHSEINLPKLQPLVPDILHHFPQFDHMVYCSQRTKDLMHRHHADLTYPPESVIINAVPWEEIKKLADEKITDFPDTSVPVFASVGRLHTRKGYHKLIEAHAKLIREGFAHQILIIGMGEEWENLQKLIKDKGVENSFHLLGNRMNPYPYLKKADFFIMPSESEAWPLVLAEALILQKPTVATDTGDVATLINHRETGYLISYDVKEMYTAMKEFLTNEDLVANIKENLRNSEVQFDSQKIFNAVEEIILNLAKK